MKTITCFVCESCSKIIPPTKGKIFQGNVYMIDENVYNRGGLIGNNFPLKKNEALHYFTIDDVHETVYCDECIKTILYIS